MTVGDCKSRVSLCINTNEIDRCKATVGVPSGNWGSRVALLGVCVGGGGVYRRSFIVAGRRNW